MTDPEVTVESACREIWASLCTGLPGANRWRYAEEVFQATICESPRVTATGDLAAAVKSAAGGVLTIDTGTGLPSRVVVPVSAGSTARAGPLFCVAHLAGCPCGRHRKLVKWSGRVAGG